MSSPQKDDDKDEKTYSERLDELDEALEETRVELEEAQAKTEETNGSVGLADIANLMSAQLADLSAEARMIRMELVEIRSELKDQDPEKEREIDRKRAQITKNEEGAIRIENLVQTLERSQTSRQDRQRHSN